KFINSGDVARIKSRSSTNLLSRKGYAERNGRSIEAFYGLKPPAAPPIYYDDSGQLPGIFIGTVYSVLSRELAALINGEKTVDDVLDILHDEGQKALLAAETAPPPGDPATGAAAYGLRYSSMITWSIGKAAMVMSRITYRSFARRMKSFRGKTPVSSSSSVSGPASFT